MLKISLSSMGNPKALFEQPIPENTTIMDMATKALEPLKLGRPIPEVFIIILNGHIIDPSVWEIMVLKPSDQMVIYPRITGGNGGEIIKTFVMIAVTIYVGNWAAAAKLPFLAQALVTTSATIGTALILNKLIPPPVPEALALGVGPSQSSSQMYSINGQANAVRRYGTVPKVYGRHRIFPPVAANPYVELIKDDSAEGMAQYFYCIYDLGLGPVQVENIKIGDTYLERFTGVETSLYASGTLAPGPWAEKVNTKLTIYKGDYQPTDVSYQFDGNQINGDPTDTWEVIRTGPENLNGVEQEIILDFICPSGLYAYNATGDIGERWISLEVMFRKVGTTQWVAFNNLDYVYNFNAIGGDQHIMNPDLTIAPINDFEHGYYSIVTEGQKKVISKYTTYVPGSPNPVDVVSAFEQEVVYGLPVHSTKIYLKTDPSIIGKNIEYKGRIIGSISGTATNPLGLPVGYQAYTISAGLFGTREPLELIRVKRIGTIASSSPITYNYEYEYNWLYNLTGIVKLKWIIASRYKIQRAQTGPVYSSLKFKPKEIGQFEVRVRRIQSGSNNITQVIDDLTWVSLSTRFDGNPIKTTKQHYFLELKIKATNQLNGAIQNLSAEVSSVLDVWDGAQWVKQVTSNPAWVMVDLLTGEVNKRALAKSRLHLPSIVEWANYCDEIPPNPPNGINTSPRFRCDFVLDYATTLQQILQQVCNAANASINMVDGKYGVLIDKLKTIPVQIFTPRNSWGFSSERNYSRKPHAVKIKWIDPSASWSVAEKVVYDDGYDGNTATEIDDLQSFACTDPDQAWRFGRYALAQNKLRQETISINVDFEHLVCTRGDYVRITQDVMKVGGYPARVRSIVGNRITIDDGIETIPLTDYGYVFRKSDGTFHQDTLTVVSSDTFDLDGVTLPSIGDLIVIGIVDEIYFDCIVTSITPNSDLSASLSLVEKADAIYLAEYSANIPTYDPKITLSADTEYFPPNEVENLEVIANSWTFNGAGYEYYVDLDWDVPTGSAYEVFEIYADSGSGYNIVSNTQETIYRYIVDSGNLGKVHNFKVIAVSATGKKKTLGEVGFVTATPVRKSTAPSNVSTLNIDITGEVLQLFWPKVTDTDIREYLIRYSPLSTGTWEMSIPLLRMSANSTLASTQGRTGTYLIKAVDYNNNESTLAAAAITTIPNLFGLNVIETITDFPTLAGEFDRVDTSAGIMTLQKSVMGTYETTEYYSEGYYYYQDLLDLGNIYTVRLQSLIQAEGFTVADLMSEWPSLDLVPALSRATFSDWDVETQYRGTDTFNSIADWTTLAGVAQLSVGGTDQWTEWKKFTIGDATARIFQFRLKLISNKINVTPRVYDGTIKADMPDRIESYNDLSAPIAGYTLSYSPAFKGPGTTPSIQISINGASSGDYWVIENRTLNGFKITFYDKNDNAVARSFDAVIKGYGRKALAVI